MKEAKCLAATLSDDECYLKGGVIKAKTKQGVTGCVARAPPKPSPPFDCSAPDARCAERIGSTHWNPCYAVNQTIPSLLDGAAAVASMGSKTLKLALFSPKGNYPWNSPAWPEDKSFKTMLEVAQHPYYRTLWQMPEITTYVLIAYSTVGGAAGGDISYWTKGITEAQVAEETSQFLACAQFLLEEYGAEGKTFVFENWEGDWASRAGGYDPSTPATPLALASMTRWLEGRQIGVSLAREAYEARAARAGTEANGKVFFSAEVNLVQDSRMTGAPNMVNRVLPFVSTDMVSYSSYDSMESPVDLKACLEFIAKNHNRTVASPKGNEAIFVAEYVKLLCVCVIKFSVSSSTYFLRLYTTSCPPLSLSFLQVWLRAEPRAEYNACLDGRKRRQHCARMGGWVRHFLGDHGQRVHWRHGVLERGYWSFPAQNSWCCERSGTLLRTNASERDEEFERILARQAGREHVVAVQIFY
jgi:hypothetical protein